MSSELSIFLRKNFLNVASHCLETISVKSIQSTLVFLALLAIPIFALAESELVTVIKSSPIYDPSSYFLHCRSTFSGEQQCERVARPDKPFPLPIEFLTTVKFADGSIETLNTRNRYSPGVHVRVKYDVVK